MALFNSLLNQAGVRPGPASRQPGQPGTSGQSMGSSTAPPRPGMPTTTVTNPAVAGAPSGRPQRPPMPFAGGAGTALPLAPASRPATPPSQAGPSSTSKPTPAPAPAADSKPAVPPQPQPGEAGGAPMTPPTFQMDRVPSAEEVATLPPNVQIMTPYGSLDRTTGKIQLSPEGKVKYQEAVVSARRRLGPTPFADNPNVPPLPVRLGRWNINPFTGQMMKL